MLGNPLYEPAADALEHSPWFAHCPCPRTGELNPPSNPDGAQGRVDPVGALARPVAVGDRRRGQEESATVLEVLRELRGEHPDWEIAPESEEVRLRIPRDELKRLLLYLIRIAASAGSPFRIRTGPHDGEGEIRLEATA